MASMDLFRYRSRPRYCEYPRIQNRRVSQGNLPVSAVRICPCPPATARYLLPSAPGVIAPAPKTIKDVLRRERTI